MRSRETNIQRGVQLLQKDIGNSPFHCFGQNQKCSSDFCKVAKNREKQSSTDTTARTPSTDPECNDETVENIEGIIIMYKE